MVALKGLGRCAYLIEWKYGEEYSRRKLQRQRAERWTLGGAIHSPVFLGFTIRRQRSDG